MYDLSRTPCGVHTAVPRSCASRFVQHEKAEQKRKKKRKKKKKQEEEKEKEKETETEKEKEKEKEKKKKNMMTPKIISNRKEKYGRLEGQF